MCVRCYAFGDESGSRQKPLSTHPAKPYTFHVLNFSPYTSFGFCPIRRRSLLGGYKAHSEALQESHQEKIKNLGDGKPAACTPDTFEDPTTGALNDNLCPPDGFNKNFIDKGKSNKITSWRRASTVTQESEPLPGAERPREDKRRGGGMGRATGGGGLARCQRLWKMVPQPRDDRPTWLRQYEVAFCLKRVKVQQSLSRKRWLHKALYPDYQKRCEALWCFTRFLMTSETLRLWCLTPTIRARRPHHGRHPGLLLGTGKVNMQANSALTALN